MDERNMGLLMQVDRKAWAMPEVRSIVPLLAAYPRDPRLDDGTGARVPRAMKEALRRVKAETGLSEADAVRLGVAEFLRRAGR